LIQCHVLPSLCFIIWCLFCHWTLILTNTCYFRWLIQFSNVMLTYLWISYLCYHSFRLTWWLVHRVYLILHLTAHICLSRLVPFSSCYSSWFKLPFAINSFIDLLLLMCKSQVLLSWYDLPLHAVMCLAVPSQYCPQWALLFVQALVSQQFIPWYDINPFAICDLISFLYLPIAAQSCLQCYSLLFNLHSLDH